MYLVISLESTENIQIHYQIAIDSEFNNIVISCSI